MPESSIIKPDAMGAMATSLRRWPVGGHNNQLTVIPVMVAMGETHTAVHWQNTPVWLGYY